MRWVLRIAGLVVVLGLLGLLALTMIPSDQVARLIGGQIEAATGQRLTIGGSVRPSLWPEPGVTISDIALAPPEGGEGLLTAERLRVAVDPGALWGGDVRVRSVEIDGPVIRLFRRADGTVNWVKTAGPAAGETAATGGSGDAGGSNMPDVAGLVLEEGRITDASVRYTDEATGRVWEAEGLDVTLRLPDTGAASAEFGGTVQGAALTGRAEIGDLAGALKGAVVPVTAALTAGASDLSFEGRAGLLPVAAEGQLRAAIADPAGFAGLLGQVLPDLPKGLGRERIELTGGLTWTAERSLHLRDGRLVLDGTAVSGDADLTTAGERPKLTARLTAGAVVLPAAVAATGAGGGGSKGKGAGQPGWSTARIDGSALSLMDAEVRLAAESVTAGGVTLAPVDATVTVDRARGVLDIARAGGFGGTVSGQLVMNNRNGLSVGGDVRAAGVALEPFLTWVAGIDRLTGTGDLRVKFLGSGDTQAAILSSLSGEGSLALASGEVKGVDLAGILRNLDAERVGTAERTQYDSLTAGFAIKAGVLRTTDATLAAPLMTATGTGQADLGERWLDLRIVPVALPDADGTGGRKVPLRIVGPWNDLSYRLDLESVAEEKLREEEARLRARAESELAERLGVDQATGEDLEDAAKRKLEEQLRKGLGGLLGGN